MTGGPQMTATALSALGAVSPTGRNEADLAVPVLRLAAGVDGHDLLTSSRALHSAISRL